MKIIEYPSKTTVEADCPLCYDFKCKGRSQKEVKKKVQQHISQVHFSQVK